MQRKKVFPVEPMPIGDAMPIWCDCILLGRATAAL
jgi:hypothetical protein